MDTIPCEIFTHILSFCSVQTHIALKITCKTYQSYCESFSLDKIIISQNTYEKELSHKIIKLKNEYNICRNELKTQKDMRSFKKPSRFGLKYPALKSYDHQWYDDWSSDIISHIFMKNHIIVKRTPEFDMIEKIFKGNYMRCFPDMLTKKSGGFALFSNKPKTAEFVQYVEGQDFCTTCKEVGHDYRVCSFTQCAVCDQYGHIDISCPSIQGQAYCKFCKNLGHKIECCPRIICRKCKKKGHTDRVCSKLYF